MPNTFINGKSYDTPFSIGEITEQVVFGMFTPIQNDPEHAELYPESADTESSHDVLVQAAEDFGPNDTADVIEDLIRAAIILTIAELDKAGRLL